MLSRTPLKSFKLLWTQIRDLQMKPFYTGSDVARLIFHFILRQAEMWCILIYPFVVSPFYIHQTPKEGLIALEIIYVYIYI